MKRVIFPCLIVLSISLFLQSAHAGVVSFSEALTDDASTGIDAANIYTHTISGGGPETVNGVTFELLDGTTTPANLSWDVSSVKNQINDNAGGWDAASGGVTGPGLQELLGSFTYNNDGAAGSNQTFTLTGLTPGQAYDFRLYCRKWDDSTERTQDVTFTAGSQAPDTVTFAEDRPENAPVSLPNRENAYYMSYIYAADAAGTLAVRFEITAGAPGAGSFHMYGMTNQLASGYQISADPLVFASTVAQGDFVSDLSGSDLGVAEPSSFELVAGDGDDDNALFQINGQELQAGAFDFSGEDDGTEFSVRVRGTGTISSETAETSFVLTLTKDSDADDLPDAWELTWAVDLTELSGLGGANFDMDTLTDLEEFQISTTSYADINPKKADSDDDGLEDGSEIEGAGMRSPTDPTDSDSDDDGLDDGVESNTGTLVSESDTGTDPTDEDTDGDTYNDGVEVAAGSDPHDPASIPPLPPGFELSGPITDLDSSGISPDLEYTHTISGGTAQTVNGVDFELLDPGSTPANFAWNTGDQSMSVITGPNNGDWVPANGGLTDAAIEALLSGFTYSGSGANPPSAQTFTLNGLTSGTTYEARLYIRTWDTEGSGRPIALTFTNGAQTASPTAPEGAPEDRPGEVLGTGNQHDAYYMSYTYTAETSEMSILAQVPDSAPGNSGSFHLYALTNHVAGPPVDFKITDIIYTDGESPSVTFTFNSKPGATYGIYASTSMLATGIFPGGWVELDDSYGSQGTETSYTDTQFPGQESRVFYQVRESP